MKVLLVDPLKCLADSGHYCEMKKRLVRKHTTKAASSFPISLHLFSPAVNTPHGTFPLVDKIYTSVVFSQLLSNLLATESIYS